jgi:hypothetical protein
MVKRRLSRGFELVFLIRDLPYLRRKSVAEPERAGNSCSTSDLGQKRRFGSRPTTSGLPPTPDTLQHCAN